MSQKKDALASIDEGEAAFQSAIAAIKANNNVAPEAMLNSLSKTFSSLCDLARAWIK